MDNSWIQADAAPRRSAAPPPQRPISYQPNGLESAFSSGINTQQTITNQLFRFLSTSVVDLSQKIKISAPQNQVTNPDYMTKPPFDIGWANISNSLVPCPKPHHSITNKQGPTPTQPPLDWPHCLGHNSSVLFKRECKYHVFRVLSQHCLESIEYIQVRGKGLTEKR